MNLTKTAFCSSSVQYNYKHKYKINKSGVCPIHLPLSLLREYSKQKYGQKWAHKTKKACWLLMSTQNTGWFCCYIFCRHAEDVWNLYWCAYHQLIPFWSSARFTFPEKGRLVKNSAKTTSAGGIHAGTLTWSFEHLNTSYVHTWWWSGQIAAREEERASFSTALRNSDCHPNSIWKIGRLYL